MRRFVLIAVLAAATTVHADPAAGVTGVLGNLLKGYGAIPKTTRLPRFAITLDSVDDEPGDYGSLLVPTGVPGGTPKQPVVGVSADGTAGWIAADVTPWKCQRGALPGDDTGDTSYYSDERCKWEQKGAFLRWALVVERDGTAWQPVAWHLYGVAPKFVGPAEHAKIDSKASAEATAAGAVFVASLADPKAMIATLSPRKDAALFGSAAGERYVGAAAIGATLAKWNLAFALGDGLRAGTAGKSVAWIAANLKATSLAKPKQAPSYYRVLFVYEHAGDKWQLVQATFSDEQAPK